MKITIETEDHIVTVEEKNNSVLTEELVTLFEGAAFAAGHIVKEFLAE